MVIEYADMRKRSALTPGLRAMQEDIWSRMYPGAHESLMQARREGREIVLKAPAANSRTTASTPRPKHAAVRCVRCGKLPVLIRKRSGGLDTITVSCPDCGYHTLRYGADPSNTTNAELRALREWDGMQRRLSMSR